MKKQKNDPNSQNYGIQVRYDLMQSEKASANVDLHQV